MGNSKWIQVMFFEKIIIKYVLIKRIIVKILLNKVIMILYYLKWSHIEKFSSIGIRWGVTNVKSKGI